MPVTFHPAKHAIEPVRQTGDPSTASHLLRKARHGKKGEILQSSFPIVNASASAPAPTVLPATKGLVDSLTNAYNNHHALSIRPDDVWIAILTQFNFFVNGNAETLRSLFVNHEGKKELVVTTIGDRHNADYGALAMQMTEKLRENIKDPKFCDWVLPKFTTTTQKDSVVSAILMMGTMKKYFWYGFKFLCGIPQVTLEGEKDDWEEIVRRVEKLKEYGDETTAWYKLLFPVLTRFVRAFDKPDSRANLDFWQKVVSYEGGGSGSRYLAGWVTAFCVFDEHGKWIGIPLVTRNTDRYTSNFGYGLTLDDVEYHSLDTEDDIPSGYADVEVKIDDNGAEYKTMMVAGIVGSRVCDTGNMELSKTGEGDLLKPEPGWWIYVTEDKGDKEEY